MILLGFYFLPCMGYKAVAKWVIISRSYLVSINYKELFNKKDKYLILILILIMDKSCLLNLSSCKLRHIWKSLVFVLIAFTKLSKLIY